MLINPLTLTLFSKALNRYIQLDPQAGIHLAVLKDKVLCISLTGTGKSLFFIFNDEGVEVEGDFAGEVDATIKASPLALARLFAKEGDQLLDDDVIMEGKVNVAQGVQKLFSELDIDWEEHLSALTGDVFAHHASNALRDLKKWVENAKSNLADNAVDYLQEEADILVPPVLVEQFYEGVDSVSMQVDRIAAKIDRLEKQCSERTK